MLAHAAPPGYQRIAKTQRPVIGPWLGRLAELIEANRDLPRKQRYTAKRMWEILVDEGFPGGYRESSRPSSDGPSCANARRNETA